MRLSVASAGFSLVAVLLFAGLTACNKTASQPADLAEGNPACGNLAPASDQGSGEQQSCAAAPGTSYTQAYNSSEYQQTGAAAVPYEQTAEAPEPPPPLPEYTQPPCPGDGYIWNPGYWGYADTGYYWVPGVWVMAPWVGALWTPPWWAFEGGAFVLNAGYWGPHIGFYGGIDYGFGYTGAGYWGAYWNRGVLEYNRVVTNVSPAVVRNVYDYRPPAERGDRISYNGGRGGIAARPTAQELAVARDPRMPAVAAQVQHAREFAGNRAQFAAGSGGRPAALVASRPLSTSYRAPAARPPAAAMRTAARTAPEARPSPAVGRAGSPEGRSMPTPFQRPEAPARAEGRPQAPAGSPGVESRVSRPEMQRAEPQRAAAPRAMPQARPEMQRAEPPRAAASRAMPQARPEMQRAEPPRAAAPRAMPQARPEMQHAAPRAMPQARPEMQRAAPRAMSQARPAPQRAAAPHPAPQERRK